MTRKTTAKMRTWEVARQRAEEMRTLLERCDRYLYAEKSNEITVEAARKLEAVRYALNDLLQALPRPERYDDEGNVTNWNEVPTCHICGALPHQKCTGVPNA